MNCINTKSKEFQELLEASKLPSLLLEMRIAKWQEINGLESFPKVEDIIQSNEVNYQKNQTVSNEGIIASEKTIRDLAAKIADRIGMKVVFESDRSKDYKGKIENNVAYVNLAYATLDTPIHEILGHPIVRAIKNLTLSERSSQSALLEYKNAFIVEENGEFFIKKEDGSYWSNFETKEKAEKELKILQKANSNETSQLYQNLLKELETGRGKEVLDRIKRDYTNKTNEYDYSKGEKISDEEYDNIKASEEKTGSDEYLGRDFYEKRIGDKVYTIQKGEDANPNSARVYTLPTYSLEEQQEEAIVELLGLMTAEKLDNVKDGKLISLLKRLLKEMKAFMRSLIGQKEVEIDKLPDNMTLGDLSDLLAYSNSKLILPGYEVEYTTPDNEKFKTYQEASNHISELARNTKDVNLNNVFIQNNNQKEINNLEDQIKNFKYDIVPLNSNIADFYTPKGRLRQNYWARKEDGTTGWTGNSPETLIEPEYDGLVLDVTKNGERIFEKISKEAALEIYNSLEDKDKATVASRQKYYTLNDKLYALKKDDIFSFIDKNKEYEQSKEIIEEWKKVNNIQYNPEEVYSRGQEFVHIHNAYANNMVETDLWLQNILHIIEDNEIVGTSTELSFVTTPKGELMKGMRTGIKPEAAIYIKAYPKSKDIAFASYIDNYTSSFSRTGDLLKAFSDKKREITGLTFTKSVPLRNIDTIIPNLADAIDNVAHHNEIVIGLTNTNFRLHYGEEVSFQSKKIIDNINSILDQKYGKLVKPEINKLTKSKFVFSFINVQGKNVFYETFNTYEEAKTFVKKNIDKIENYDLEDAFNLIYNENRTGIQPIQTNETLKESIDSIKRNQKGVKENYYPVEDFIISKEEYESNVKSKIDENLADKTVDEIGFNVEHKTSEGNKRWRYFSENGDIYFKNLDGKETYKVRRKQESFKEKEYTSQALINTKIAALKEVAKKQPRSLIRSEVKPINRFDTKSYEQFDELEDLPFQKVPNKVNFNDLIGSKKNEVVIKEGVRDLFEANPELANIGTPEQYSQYLNTIFPDSKIKDIVYHGSKEKFDTVDVSKSKFQKGFYFAKDKSIAKEYGNILSLLVNSKNIQMQPFAHFGYYVDSKETLNKELVKIKSLLKETDLENSLALQLIDVTDEIRFFNTVEEKEDFRQKNSGWENVEKYFLENKLKEIETLIKSINEQGEFDTMLTHNDDMQLSLYAVGKSEQIHILGSKQDIEGFKKFVNKNNTSVTFSKEVDFTDVTSNNETTIFENITPSKAEIENQKEVYITENNELLLGGQPRLELKAEEVLRNIISSTQVNNFKEVAFFLEKAFNLLNKSGAKFKIIDNDKFNEMSSEDGEIQGSTIMLYDSVSNTIYSSKEKLSNYTPEQTTEAFIHEVVHSVSVKAYFDPQTFAEHQFKQFIDEAYEQYKYLSEELDGNGNQMYGFTNQAEFIAEIYSNPKFRAKIESLEKGFIQRLIDSIRRFLNMPSSIFNNEVIKSSLLFSKVDGFIENENNPYSKWKGTIFNNSKYGVFAKIEESQKTNLQTIEDKINNSLEKINESLSINITKYKKLINSFEKKGYNTSGLSFVNDNLTELRDTINEFEESEKILGILTFLDDMGSTLDYVEKKLKTINNEDADKIKSIIKIQDDYLSTYNVINDIKDLVASLSETKSDIVTDEELQEMQNLLDKHLGKYERLTREIYELKKRTAKEKLLNIKYFPEIEKKHYDRLAIEHRNNKIAFDKNQWIIEKMTGRDKDLISNDLEEAVNKFLNNPTYDIYSGDVLFNSAINVSSPMIQIMNNILNQIDNNRIEEERTKDLEFKKLFDELIAEKGTNNTLTLYENIIEKDDTGNYFLKNEYKIEFYNEVVKKIKNLRSEIYFGTQELQKQQSKLIKEGKENTPEYLNLIAEIQNLKISKEAEIEKIEKDNLELNEETRYVPKKKWLSDKKLSTTEQKVLDFFNQITLQSAKDTYFQESLIKNGYGTSFYELPKITKSFTERVFQGDVVNGIKDNWTDLTTVRPDDIGYTTLERDMSGNPIYKIPIHYRSNENFKSTDQSLDLFNIYRLEYKNGNTFKHRNNVETDLHFLLDIAKDLKYYKNTGTSLELNSRNKKLTLIEGDQSQTIKMLTNMMETKFYDILNKNGTKVGNVELNKAVTKLNGITSFLALSLNIASGTANVLNGSSQLFLESFLKGQTIKASSIAKAESFYIKDMMNIVADQTNSINISFTNQVLEMFNIKGDRSLSQANFLRSDMLKKGLHPESLQIIQSTGEHWLNSVITFSVLDGVKVMDENHNYLTKEGKITTNLGEAASVLDMLDKNENNLVKLKDSVAYTTHSKLVKWNEGGKEMIDALLYKKIYDMIGNYRATDQSEIYRHWGGKLTMLYRKYLVPMGIARLRGIETSLKRKEDLEEKDRRFSYALQEYEEGTYTTLIRYIKSSVKDGQRWLTLKDNWNNLTDYEQHNVKKAVTEIILTSILTPLAVMFAGAAADDDDELMYFIAYQLRRLDTELSAYRSIEESFKTLRSPIPSTRFLEHALWSVNSILNPFAWENLTEVYETGPHKGDNKFLIKQQKQLPLVKEFLKNWEDLYEFQSKPVAGFGK